MSCDLKVDCTHSPPHSLRACFPADVYTLCDLRIIWQVFKSQGWARDPPWSPAVLITWSSRQSLRTWASGSSIFSKDKTLSDSLSIQDLFNQCQVTSPSPRVQASWIRWQVFMGREEFLPGPTKLPHWGMSFERRLVCEGICLAGLMR